MQKLFVGSILASSLLMVSAAQAQMSPAMPAHGNMSMAPPSGAITTVLSGPLGSRSASGSATVTGQSVQVVWNGDTPGSVRAWSVRQGSCSAEGPSVAATLGYGAMTVDAQGKGAASVTFSAPLNLSEAVHIAVRASQDSTAERLACGSLSSGPMMAGHAASHDMSGMTAMAGASDNMAGMDHSKMPGMKGNMPAKDSGMAGMDHSQMPGMKPNMAGMDHSKMTGTDSTMKGMDHSKMPAMNSSMAGMDHSKMSGMNAGMAGMDHNAMDHSSMNADATKHAPVSDSASRVLMAIHQRMMLDPVIRERVASDPTLQRLMEQLSGVAMPKMDRSSSTARKTGTLEAGAKRGVTAPIKPPVASPSVTPATKTPVKAPAKDSVKPAMAPMPGLDHSKMPGMKKQPV